MMGVSLWQLFIVVIILVIPFLIFPAVLKKAGFSGWWTLCLFIPVINILLIWLFAFTEWPNEKTQ